MLITAQHIKSFHKEEQKQPVWDRKYIQKRLENSNIPESRKDNIRELLFDFEKKMDEVYKYIDTELQKIDDAKLDIELQNIYP